ncbi:MAG: sigma-70 family RNA polymerase sigma factor [Acidobacteria bacterium]|nr:sigma-70 family RNA polymerase sigma factor [Acidobacteriota bacterium]
MSLSPIFGDALLLWMSRAESPGAEESAGLARRAREGDLNAFDRLMQLHERRVFRTATLLLGGAQDADDAVQETFLRLFRNLKSFDAERAFEPWLYRIAVNVCRDLARRRRWRQWVSLDGWLSGGGPEPAAAGGDPRTAEIAAALARLSERERAAVVLREVEGLSAAEAGRVLGISEGTVRAHASRGRARLREWLGKGAR